MAQAWPGPAQARPGPYFGNMGTWKSRNLESKKISKMKILKIKIHVAQNVGKVWINRKKSSWPHLGPFQANFSMDRKHAKIAHYLPIFLGGPMAAIRPLGATFEHELVNQESDPESACEVPRVSPCC